MTAETHRMLENPSVTACSEPRVSWLAAMLLPSFGSVVFAVSLCQVLFLSGGPQTLFRDSDTGWHVRNGEAILDNGAVPRVDGFSYTREGRQWLAWEWLSDALLGATHRTAGLPGVALLAALAIALTAWGTARFSLSLGCDFMGTAAAIVLLLVTTSIHWLARPHVFSWLVALLFLSIVERERQRSTRGVYALPLLSCLWANIHASFLLGPLILFAYAAGEALNAERVRRDRFAAAGLASLAATFVNPQGWQLHGHILAYLTDGYLMDHIVEFRSFSFHSPGAHYIELFLLVAVVGVLALLRQRAWGPGILALVMLHLGLYSARHLPLAAVLLLPLCLAALTREAETWPRLDPLIAYSRRLRAIDRRVWGVVPVSLVLIATIGMLTNLARSGTVGFSALKFPVHAADFIEQRALEGRIFAKDQWDGYLIYRLAGRTKVFVDGRSDFYGRELLETYAQVVEVKPGWDDILRRYDVRFVLVPPDNALASVLRLSTDWKAVYADPVAAMFERVG